MEKKKEETSSLKRHYFVLFVSLMLDLLGFTLILPLIPSLLDYYAIHDHSGWYSYFDSKIQSYSNWIGSPVSYNKVLYGGLLGSWFSLLQFLVTPFIGSMSDIIGRKIPLLICLIGITCSYVLWIKSTNCFLLFILSRTIGGLFKGNISLSTAIVADVSNATNRAAGMALIGFAFSIGFIFGPIMGAIFAAHSKVQNSKLINSTINNSQSQVISSSDAFFVTPAFVSLTLASLNVIFVALFFQESLPCEGRVKSIGTGLKKAACYVNPFALFSFRAVSGSTAQDGQILQRTGSIYFHFLFLYSGLEYSLSFLAHSRFHFTSIQQGKMYLFVGVIMAIVQGGFVRRIKSGSEPFMSILGISLVIPSFIIIGLSRSLLELYFGLGLYSLSSGIVVPTLTTLASQHGPSEEKGIILGIFRSLGSLARALGPLASSAIFWKFGPTICYLGGAILMIVPLIQVAKLRQILSTSEKQVKRN